ncbi:MAG: alpha/beta fold hydrolase [Bacteroidales bacterium]
MKINRIGLIATFLLISVCAATAQKSYKDIEGAWSGSISESVMTLRLVFNFTLTEADTVRATLDSPDQGAIGIPLGRVTLEGDTLIVDAPMLKGQFKGAIASDTTITGIWTQLGKKYPVELKRGAKPVTYNRPQEPVPPYPYKEEEVTFRNNIENFDLAGTLTLPEGNGPFAAVVMITGSGQEDRNETVFNHKPFLVIADYLARNGIAVLRYDDRGFGKSKGNAANATSLSFADDAAAAVSYLLGRPEINPKKIGLMGHSEGGLIAPIVASKNKNIAFIVSLAGTGVSGYNIIIKQTRDILAVSGVPEKEIEETVAANGKLFEMIIAEPDQRKLAKDAMEWYGKELDKKGLTPEARKEQMASFTQGLVSANNPWMRYFLATDPAPFWSEVKCPVLALNGEKDLQVNYEENLPAIKAALKKGGNKKVKTISLPMLNHLFQHCTTGAPAEYSTIEETFSPEALEIIAKWIKKTVKVK